LTPLFFFFLSQVPKKERKESGVKPPHSKDAAPKTVNTFMMKRLLGTCIFMAVFAIAFARSEPLKFSATGCGPYKPEEEPLLEKYVKLVNDDKQSEFFIHLGDIVSGSKKAWPESQYANVAGLLKKATIPAFVVLGDNEYNDLDKPADGLKFWRTHFLHFDKQFKYSWTVHRQEKRDENFAWTHKGVLLIGINLVGGRLHDKKEWATRMQDDNDWIKDCFAKWKQDVRAAVVMAQAMPTKDHEPFFKAFADECKQFEKPVLYLHADGHVWEVHKKWRAPNLLRVQTDMISKAPPVLVTVTDDANEPFVFDRRLKKST